MLRVVVLSAALGAVVAGPAQAQFLIPGLTIQTQPSAGQQRAYVRPYILAMTNCVAKRVLEDSAGVEAFRDNAFSPYVSSIMDRCPGPLSQLSRAYEQAYGEGQADAFINGPYAKDLPRAVLARIQPQLQAELDDLRQEQAAQTAKDAQAKLEEQAHEQQVEAEQQRASAEAEQQAATARADADRAKAQEMAAAQMAEAERLKQVEVATGAAKLLAGKALDCGRDQLKSLVKSGESAEVLASAVMTMCDSEVDHFVEAGAKEYTLENQTKDDDVAVGLAKEKLKAETRDHIVALAVQAKAGVGAFAPTSSN